MSKWIQRACLVATGAILLLLAPHVVMAQNRQSGEIRGTVSDASGGVIPDAGVTITNVLTGVSIRVRTNASGVYDAPSVPPGDFTLTFEKDGFNRLTRSGITLHLQTITLDAVLEVGSTANAIEVKAETPLIQTENAEQSTFLSDQVTTEVPNVGRSYYNLFQLMSGVNSGTGGSNANGAGIGVNGNAAAQYSWQIDGAIAMLPINQNPDLMRPPLDSIEEVKFATSNLSAEYGNGFAAFNVTTKSGTNQFHGSLFEYVQNDKMNARTFFARSNPPLRWNQFGGTIGGPIKRDKVFFFFTYQKETNATSSSGLATVPSAAMKSGDFSATSLQPIYDPDSLRVVDGEQVRSPLEGNIIPPSRIDPIAANIQSFYPSPNQAGVVSNYYYVTRSTTPPQWFSGKVNYNLANNNRLTASFTRINQDATHGSTFCNIDCGYYHYREYQASLTDVWTVRPNLVGEFRLGLAYENEVVDVASQGKGFPAQLGFKSLPADMFPGISISGSISPSGLGNANTPANDDEVIWTPSATFSWIKGKHIVKFGAEFGRWLANGGWPNASAGSFSFDGIATANPAMSDTGEGYADFLLGEVSSWGMNAQAIVGGRMWNAQAFVQDDYKIRPNLTLSFGLRFSRTSGWSEVANRLSTLDFGIVNPGTGRPPAMWYGGQNGRTTLEDPVNFFAPRLGFAWSPYRKWSIRGGYGIYSFLRGSYAYANGLGQGWTVQGDV